MAWLIGIVCIILIIIFWRIFIPIALLVAVGFGILLLYSWHESDRSERRRAEAEQATKKRIADALANPDTTSREWGIGVERDPASGEDVPRNASVVSDNGLCRLQVEERIDKTRLTGIYCEGLKLDPYQKVQVKFANRSTSDAMDIAQFSDGDDVYIRSRQYSSDLEYNEFMRRLSGAGKVSLRLNIKEAGEHWITFSLAGSGPALAKIGALAGRVER